MYELNVFGLLFVVGSLCVIEFFIRFFGNSIIINLICIYVLIIFDYFLVGKIGLGVVEVKLFKCDDKIVKDE